ncbi:hypothetical protein [Methylobacterium sp. C25]|uniref:hypothetical protein n=1 Tax=Methylobacterium sp. C25 TaxID=2721622 RepID=UPI003FA35F47
MSERLEVARAVRGASHQPPALRLPCLRNAIVQVVVPARLIEGGLPPDALVAQVLVSKYADHLPL